MPKADFTLGHFMAQMAQVKGLGPTGKVIGMIPGMRETMREAQKCEADIDRALNLMRGMYDAMTPLERTLPETIDNSRRQRIARGAGVAAADVAQFLRQFEQTRAMMLAVGSMGVLGRTRLVRAMRQPDPVLGLVTHNRTSRDPSTIHPTRPGANIFQEPWRMFPVVALLAAAYLALRALLGE